MFNRILNASLVLALFASCNSVQTTASQAVTPKIAVHVPQVTISPAVWETCGSEIVPSFKITTPPHTEQVTYRFEYEGDGSVELPNPVSLEAGSTSLMIKSPFRTKNVTETAQGIVRIIWEHPDAGEKVAGMWTVVQRPSVLREVRVARADELAESDEWNVTFAITVELDPVEEWVEQSINEHRDVMFQASAGSEVGSPEIQVMADVDTDEYPNFPREITPLGPHKSYIVSVKRPRLPARKRPFLQIKARSGGDSLERFLKLPF